MASPVKFIRQLQGRFLLYPLLLIIPLILFITSLDTIGSRDQAWFGGGYDPEYAYLFNSLNMAEFRLAGHVDHPGTTTQVAGGIVLKVAWWIDPRGTDLTTAVLSDPEHYVEILNIAAAVIGSVSLLLLGWFLTASTGVIWYGLLLQLTPFISGFVLFNGFARITQEVMQMAASFAMAALTLHWYFKAKNGNSVNYTLWFAVIAGFGLASKFIFFPLLVIPLILLSGWKSKFSFVKLSVLFFIVFTLPVIRMYPSMLKWIYNLLFHTGQYGSGSEGVIDSSRYISELFNLFKVNPYLIGLVILSIAVLAVSQVIRLVRKRYPDPAAVLVLAAVVAAQTIGYLLVAKQPKPSYLLPYECVTAVNVVIILHLAVSVIRGKNLRFWILGVLTVILIVPGIKSGIARKHLIYNSDRNHEYVDIWGAATGANQKQAVVCINPGASPMAGLFFGNAYSRSRYVKELGNIYPDFYILDAYNNRIIHWGGDPITLDDLFRKYNGNLLVLSTAMWVEVDAGLLNLKDIKDWKMAEVYNGRGKLLAPVRVSSDGTEGRRKIIFDGAESPVADQAKSQGSANTRQANAGILTYDHAHTGQSCVMTTAGKPYAFGVEEHEILPGEKFSVGVWIYGESGNVSLVGSATDSKEFYVVSAKVIAEEKTTGWKKIALEFMVDKPVTGDVIKIYARNNGKEPVYLDDFRCDRISPLIIDNSANE